jgi:hypothetical protein
LFAGYSLFVLLLLSELLSLVLVLVEELSVEACEVEACDGFLESTGLAVDDLDRLSVT